LRALSLCTCCRHCPGAAAGRRPRSSHPAVSAFPDNVVGSACTSSFSRFAQRSLALRPAHSRGHLYVTSYTEGFSHFVTSMTAPAASGWSGCRVGLAPTGKRRLVTAHTSSRHPGLLCGRRSGAESVRPGQRSEPPFETKVDILTARSDLRTFARASSSSSSVLTVSPLPAMMSPTVRQQCLAQSRGPAFRQAQAFLARRPRPLRNRR
jgi:hypothetical protein